MIKATCPCGATFESDTGSRSEDKTNVNDWLDRHQACVTASILAKEISNKKAIMKHFTDHIATGGERHHIIDETKYYVFSGVVYCKECKFQQGGLKATQEYVHAEGCPNE